MSSNTDVFSQDIIKSQTMSSKVLCLMLLLIAVSVSLTLTQDHEVTHEFCWKDTYGRGIGKIPQSCPADKDRIGLLCYPKCPANMDRFGFDCHSVCPSGWADQGLFCRLTQYGRGAGFPWKFGDKFNDNGMRGRCEKKHGKGNCEKNGWIYYPKCKSGYKAFGCCICRPKAPDCGSFNLGNQIDLSCAKKIIIGNPSTGSCSSSDEKDAGLCYKKCDTGYYGVGPVCWGKNPSNWVGCGMGSAVNSKTCVNIIFDQVSSVGEMALNLATMGTSAAANEAATASENAKKLKELQKKLEELKDAYDRSAGMVDILNAAQNDPDFSEIANQADKIDSVSSDKLTIEDIARIAAMIAALADPTGIAGTIAAYTYPKCSKIFGTSRSAEVASFKKHNDEEDAKKQAKIDAKLQFEEELRQTEEAEAAEAAEQSVQTSSKKLRGKKAKKAVVEDEPNTV